MTQKRKVTLAVSLMVTAVSLAGCGGGGSVGVQATDQGVPQTFGAAPTSQTATNGPVYRNSTLQVFTAQGSQQVVVKTRPGSVLAAKPHMHTVRSIQTLHVDVISLD